MKIVEFAGVIISPTRRAAGSVEVTVSSVKKSI
jgi:hypothetical protein